MAQETEIVTPENVRQLQITLYRKAKAQPKYRFWSLYGELLRLDVLESALDAQIRNQDSILYRPLRRGKRPDE